jgi:hypothetical protein
MLLQQYQNMSLVHMAIHKDLLSLSLGKCIHYRISKNHWQYLTNHPLNINGLGLKQLQIKMCIPILMDKLASKNYL